MICSVLADRAPASLEPDQIAGKLADDALEIGENAVAPLGVELVDSFLEEPRIVYVPISFAC